LTKIRQNYEYLQIILQVHIIHTIFYISNKELKM